MTLTLDKIKAAIERVPGVKSDDVDTLFDCAWVNLEGWDFYISLDGKICVGVADENDLTEAQVEFIHQTMHLVRAELDKEMNNGTK